MSSKPQALQAQVVFDSSPSDFTREALPFLERSESVHCLLLANCLQPSLPAGTQLIRILDSRGKTRAAAIRMDGDRLLLSFTDLPDLVALENALAAKKIPVRSVIGPAQEAHRFSERWARRTGRKAELHLDQRVYECLRVTPPARQVPGAFREAVADDLEVLLRWHSEFAREALGENTPIPPERIHERIERHELFLWELNGSPVSTAGVSGRTTTGIRVNSVYTPRENRGQGFAAATTAALTSRMFELGLERCFLFTDLNNPTSNAIYQEVGYLPVCGMRHYVMK